MALSINETSLRVNVLDVTGASKVGLIPGVTSFRRTRSLNQVGNAEIVFPTPVVKDLGLVQPGRRYIVYHQQYGLVGVYLHRSHVVSGDQATTTIQADDLLKSWARRTTKMNRRYGDAHSNIGAITTVVQAITDLATSMNSDPSYIAPESWSAAVFDPTNILASQAIAVDFQGQTMFEAVDALRKLTRTQFRLNDSLPYSPVLEFGNFFTGSLSLYGSALYGDPYFGSLVGGSNLYATNSEVYSRDQEASYGRIIAITVTYGGDHYATAPTVTIDPPTGANGVQATAVAIIDTTTHKVSQILITNPGAGYTIPPNVTISGGTPTTLSLGGFLILESSSYLLQEDGSSKFLLEAGNAQIIIPATARAFVGSDMILVTDCTISQETDKVVNRVIVLGAGDGLNQFTMEKTYLGYPSHTPPGSTYPYAVKRGLNPDNETYFYYLEDSGSIGNYGLFEDVVAQPSIRPLTNSDVSQLLASDALYYIGAAYLTANKAPATVYTIKVQNLPPTTRPGNVLFFRYAGQVSYTDDTGTDTYRYIDVNAAAVIMDINETFLANGNIDSELVISTNGERGVTETDVIIGTQQSINAIKVSVQPYPCRDSVTARQELAPGFPMEFIVPVENEVLNVLKATITLVTKPFRSVINPQLANLGSITLPPTTNFTYYGDPGADPSTWTLTTLVDLFTNFSDIPHTHRIPIRGGFNGTGSSTNGVPDGWYLTWGGGDLNVGSAYPSVGDNGRPPWADSLGFYLVPNGTTQGGSHRHIYQLARHFHTIPAVNLGNVSIGFGIYDDLSAKNLPTGVSLIVNGFLVQTLPTPGAAPITIDISNEIQKTAGNLIHLECTDGRGQIEATVRLFLSVQATIPTL